MRPQALHRAIDQVGKIILNIVFLLVVGMGIMILVVFNLLLMVGGKRVYYKRTSRDGGDDFSFKVGSKTREKI